MHLICALLLCGSGPFQIPDGPFTIPEQQDDALIDVTVFVSDPCPACGEQWVAFGGDRRHDKPIVMGRFRLTPQVDLPEWVDSTPTSYFQKGDRWYSIRGFDGLAKWMAAYEEAGKPIEKQLLWFRSEREASYGPEHYPGFAILMRQGWTFGARGNIRFVEIESNRRLAEEHGVQSHGTFVLVENGRATRRHVGDLNNLQIPVFFGGTIQGNSPSARFNPQASLSARPYCQT